MLVRIAVIGQVQVDAGVDQSKAEVDIHISTGCQCELKDCQDVSPTLQSNPVSSYLDEDHRCSARIGRIEDVAVPQKLIDDHEGPGHSKSTNPGGRELRKTSIHYGPFLR